MENEESELLWSYEEATLNKDEALLFLAECQNSTAKALEDADEMNVDQEYRLTLLELGLTE